MERPSRFPFDAKQIICTVIGAILAVGLVFLIGLHLGKQISGEANAHEATPGIEAEVMEIAAAPTAPVVDDHYRFFEMLDAPAPKREMPTLNLPMNPVIEEQERLRKERRKQKRARARRAKNGEKAPKTKAKSKKNATSTKANQAKASATASSAPKRSPTTPATAKSKRYTVQVSAFQDQDAAKQLAKELARSGYSTHVKRETVEGKGTWYRVRVGRFDDRSGADAAQSKIAKRYGLKGFVAPY